METAVLLGEELETEAPIPEAAVFREAYAPSYSLLVPPGTAEDKNDRATLEKIQAQCLRNLRFVEGSPGVTCAHIPVDTLNSGNDKPLESAE